MAEVGMALVAVVFTFVFFGHPNELLDRFYAHRERMAKIKRGENPDASEAPKRFIP